MAEPTAQEILMWALLNRARLDPAGEAARYGIDLNEGGVTDFNKAPFTITTTSKQPLAWNAALFAVADQHSAEMLANQRMYHNDQAVHQQNLTNAGYAFSWWGENIAQQPLTSTIDQTKAIELQHQALFVDTGTTGRGHRYNMMLDNFQEVGIGQIIGTYQGATNSLVTQDFGRPAANTQFLTGIAYNDTDNNSFYSIGEGRGGVTVTTTAGNVVSGTAGAFSKAINAGVQTISFSGGGLPQTVSAEITVAAGRNALVDLVGTSTLETSVSLKALSGVIKIIGLGNIGLTLTGNTLDNSIVSALGADTINGDAGTDTVVYSGTRASYAITTNVATGVTTVTRAGITDTLTQIEKLQFDDQLFVIGGAPANRAPVALVSDHSLQTNQTANIASWVAYSDADGDAAVQYQIIDNGTAANSGALIGPTGAVVAAGTTLTVTAAQLASVTVRGGSVAGTETMQIRAFDGKDWGAWDSFNFTTTAPANHAPTVAVADKTLAANAVANVSPWVSYSDADNNAATQYQIIDNGTAANSAQLIAPNGTVVTAGTTLTVSAADLANVKIKGGAAAGTDGFQIRAFDGTDWSAWDAFAVTTTAPVNNAPTVAVADKTLAANTLANLSPWVSYSDADNNAATQYQIIDNGTAANSAQLVAPNGSVVAAGTTLTVSAADLANVKIKGGAVAGTDGFQIRAFDGAAWSAWDAFAITTTAPVVNRAPVAAIDDKSLKINQWGHVADWLRYSDADGNAAVRYEFWDGQSKTTSGYFWTPDDAHHAAGVAFSVEAADVGNVWVRGGSVAGSETMYVRAFDGTSWSAWDSFKVTTLANAAPVATINDKTVKSNEWVKVSDILTYSDANGDAAVRYEFNDLYNGTGSGYFWYNGQKVANQVFSVEAADLANVWVRGAAGSGWENMQVRAFDGITWSAWDNFKLTTVANAAPVATINDTSVSKNQWVQASTLLTATDANGDAITQYQFVDGYDGAGSAYFYTPDNIHHAANEVFTVNAADLTNVWLRGGTGAGWDSMQVRAFDGTAWGAWDSFKFTTLNNTAPVVSGNDIDLHIGQKVAASSLFAVADPDIGDLMTQYQFFDDTADATSGHFTLGKKAVAADTTYTVTAANLAKLTYTAGSAVGSDLLWVRAFDGDSWSDWHKFDAHTII